MAKTMKEIAELAGVSVGTVSYVVNNTGRVGREKRERVLRIMRENGFTPNNNARNLIKGRNLRIGIIVPDAAYIASSIFFGNITSGIMRELAQHGMDLVVQVRENSYERWLKNALGVDGAIIINPENSDEYLDWLKSGNIPFVIVGRLGEEKMTGLISLDSDNVETARAVTGRVLEAGHKEVLYSLGLPNYTITEDFTEGIRRAYAERGRDAAEACFAYSDYAISEDPKGLSEILRSHPNVSAVVAASDSHAVSALKQLHALGIAVPSQMSVACFSGTYLTRSVTPPLLASYTSFEEIGVKGTRALIALIEGREKSAFREKLPFVIEGGESVGAPREQPLALSTGN